MKVIGGEYEMYLPELCSHQVKCNGIDLKDLTIYASGRSAFYYILKSAISEFGIRRILLPDYLCCSIVEVVEKLRIPFDYYRLNSQLEVDMSDFQRIYEKGTAVLLINYFGLQDMKRQIERIKIIDSSAVVIEDDVPAYFEFAQNSSIADYKFTSLRKTFPVPDGGFVKTTLRMEEPGQQNLFSNYKYAGGYLKAHRDTGLYEDSIYLELLERGEQMIGEEIETSMNTNSISMCLNIDVDAIKRSRRENAMCLVHGLAEMGLAPIIPIRKDSIPLFVPIYLSNRDIVRRRMFENNIFCPIHWPVEDTRIELGRDLAEHELSLIVDHRYSTEDMVQMLNVLKSALI